MLHTYIEGQDVEKYDTAYGSAYDMGKEGVKLDYVKKSILTNYLSESQIELAYEAGQAAAKTVDYSSVESIESIKNGKMTLKLNNGNTISSDEVIYASSGDAVLYETVANLGVDAGTANQIIKSYDESIEVTTFAKGIEEAVRYGKTGISMNDLMKNADFANELTETQRDLAYKAGKKLAGKEVARQQNKKTPRNASKAEAKIGNVHYNGDTSKLNDKQRVGYETAVMISKALGIDIYFFESYLKDGTRVYKDTNGNEVKAPNGWYDTNNSSIHIDINAGMSGEGTILFTLSHELTHFIKEWSPRKFKVLANFLFEQFGNTEQSVDNLIRSKMDSLGLSYDAAYEEVVADSMETILSTGNVVDMMAALKQHDKTLWQKIYDYFKNFAQRLKNIVNTYGNVRPDSAEGRLVADMRAVEAMNSVIATLEQLFAEGLVEASENFQNSTEAVDENTVQYQGRFYLSAEAEVFGREIEEWAEYGRPEGETFILGSTGDVLQGLGAIESDIYMQGDKINTILEQHPEMTLEEIKKVPQILENPILILKSRNVGRSTKANSRIVMFGTVKAQNGQPVLTVLDLRPSENHLIIDDMQKVTSAYTKDNDPISFVKRSEVLYADKKRTVGLLRSIGFQMPKDLLLNGYVGSISYSGTEVNITGVPFSEVFSDNGKKFSMRNTVEETADLVAIHNITEDKLAKAIELGGLPMPSIAVTKASIPHTNFGDISLIFSKGTIDPKANRKNTVYSADAWTPVFPQVEYEADPQVHRRIAKKLNELGNRVDELFKRDLRLVQTDFEGMLNRYGGEAGLIDYVLENYGLKAAYLEEQGHHVSAVTTQVEADKGYNVNNAEKYQRVMDAVNEHTPEGIGQLNLKDTRDKYGAELENAYPGITKSAIRMSSVFRQIQSYLRDSEGTPVYETVTDEKATKQAVDDAINQTNFESWVRELFSGIEKSKGIYNNKPLFTNSGNRRSFAQTHLEVTLDNIVKAMATQNGGSTKNVSGFNGVKTLRAATAEKFSSVEAMHTRESRLQNLTTEQFEEINDNLSHSLYNVISAIDKANGEKGNSNSLFRYDTIGEIITEICESGRYGLSDIQSTFGKYSMEVNDDIALELKQLIYDITQMPVNLFEAKPERAVGFEEVAAVLVPDDTNADLLSGIENAGMRVIKYERGNSNARIDALNSVEGIKFSERVSNVVRDYSYEALISKPDMPITTVEETGKISRAEVVSQAQKNAASVGYTNENGNAVVHVEDTGIDVLVSKHGLTHGLDRRLEVLAPVTLKIGEILKNSIRINELTPAKENVSGSYVLIGAAKNANGDFYVVRSVVNSYNNELSSVDVLYAIHTKKETAVLNEPAITENPLRITVSQEPAALLPRFTDKAASFSGSIKNQPGAYPQGSQSNDRFLSGSVISIAELLEYVNEYFPDILPESVLKHFGHDARPEGTLGESALFQDRSEELEKVNRVLEKENEKLKDDVSSLRELLKLQRSVTGGTKFKKSSVEAAANVLIKNTNAKGNKTELAPYLNTLYEYIAKNEDITWEGVMERADAAVKWLQDHITVKKKLDPHAALILRDLRNTRVYLDDVQKQEVSYRFDSYNNYRQKLMGSIILTDKASVSLDTKWQELSSKYPDFFDPNTNAADMPIALAEAILTLRDMDISNMDYAYDWEMAAQDLRMQVYDTYWNVSALYTVADAKQKEINKLKYHHAKRMSELRDTHKDNVKKLKIEYRRKIEDLRKAYRERSEKKQQQIIERYQESRERASENRKKTAMRNKIKGVVSELNQYLLRGTKDKHVPIELQKAVAEALDIINMDTVGAEERVAYYNELIQKHANDPDVVAELTASRDRIQAQGDKLHEKLAQLKSAYADIKESTDPLIANSYDEVIASTMDAVVKSVGNTPLRDMTLSQLEDVYDLYKMTLTVIRNANKAFKAAKRENIAVLGNRVMEEVDKFSKDSPYSVKLAEGIKTFDWNNLKPVYAFERIGSNTLTDLYNNVRTGEDTWAKDVSEAREFYLRTTEKYGFKSWDMDKLFSFKSRTGVEFSLSLEQIMSLYAYSKREQAGAHLERGGFVFDSNITVTKKTKLGIPLEYNVRTANAHNLSPEILGEIISKLTPQQKGFADEMQDYLSTVMGEKGNEISLEMYGVKLFKEKNYFPLKSARQFMFEQQEVAGEVKIKNSGFTKETVVNASNPIILSNFTDVWARHVNEMSMYHSFVLPLEDFNRVFNYKTPTSETLQSESVKTQLQNAYGTQPADYIKQLLTDLNGGAVSDPREHTAKRLLAKFKKASVFASLSVVIQQPSAIGRAFAEIDPKYFVGRRLDKKSHKYLWAQLKKYAPVATIKEMGYFDTNMGRSATDFIAGTEYHGIKEKAKALITDSNYRDEVISRAPALMDELTWCAIWDAAKRETKANNPKLDVRSEEFLTKAGQRFTEVVTKTQVYDSVLARSGNMRSKGVFMNMWTSFMAEPTTTINMLEDALVKLQRGDKKKAGKVIAAATTSVFFNSILVSLVYAMRDDDEDETFLEKYLSSFTTEILDGINPLTYIPLIKDIWSLLQGYDIERADMTLISRAIDSTTKIIGLIGKDTEDMSDEQFEKHQGNVKNALWDVVDDITSLFGLPVKNIRRDANGVINFIKTVGEDLSGRTTTWSSVIDNAWGSAKNTIPVVGWLPDKSKSDILYAAITSGDEAYAERLEGSYATESAYNSAVRKGLRENDARIFDAAVAKMAGDASEYLSIVKEIVGEGFFSQDNVVSAIKQEVSARTEKESSGTSKAVAIFTADDYFNAVINGDASDVNVVKNELIDESIAKGNTRNQAESSVESGFVTNVKEAYEDGDLGKAAAINYITQYGGKTKDEAEAEIKKVDFEIEYGFTWSEKDNAFRLGAISESELVIAYMDIEGKTKDEALAAVEKLHFTNDYGFDYSDIDDAFFDGKISQAEAKEMYITYGGMSEKDATEKVAVMEFVKQHPEVEGITYAAIESYTTYSEAYNVPIVTFYDAWKYKSSTKADVDANGEAISGSKKSKVLAYIDTLALTDAQKDSLYYAFGWALSTLHEAPWH